MTHKNMFWYRTSGHLSKILNLPIFQKKFNISKLFLKITHFGTQQNNLKLIKIMKFVFKVNMN